MNKIEKLREVFDLLEVDYEDINENEILVPAICDRIPNLEKNIKLGIRHCIKNATSCETDEAPILISYLKEFDSLDWGIFLKDYEEKE